MTTLHKTRTTDTRCASTRAMILVLTIDDGMELGCLDGTDEGFGFDDKARNGRRGKGEKACTYVDVEAMHDMHVEHVETTATNRNESRLILPQTTEYWKGLN